MYINQISSFFHALTNKNLFGFVVEKESVKSSVEFSDYRKTILNLKKIDSYLLAKEIHDDICLCTSDQFLEEIRIYKWIESEKAGCNLWEEHGTENLQLVAAGKQWVKIHWEAFKDKHVTAKKCLKCSN